MGHKAACKLVLLLLIIVAAGYCLAGIGLQTREHTIRAALNEEEKTLPVVMYHAALKDSSRSGKFVVTPDQFEKDMRYLLEQGYQTVNIADLIAYVDNQADLPEKPIMITFDDGYYNNYLYIFPIIKELNIKIVLSPIAKYSQLYTEKGEHNAYYTHITWPMAQEMVQSGLVELQNHSYDMHASNGKRNGARKMKGESTQQYQEALRTDLKRADDLLRANTGSAPTAFTYPFGSVSYDSYPVIKELGYRASLSCESGINTIRRGDPECLYMLKRNNRPSGKSSESYFKGILE